MMEERIDVMTTEEVTEETTTETNENSGNGALAIAVLGLAVIGTYYAGKTAVKGVKKAIEWGKAKAGSKKAQAEVKINGEEVEAEVLESENETEEN